MNRWKEDSRNARYKPVFFRRRAVHKYLEEYINWRIILQIFVSHIAQETT